MKIIKNNIGEEIKEKISKFPMKVTCEYCDSEMEIEEEDLNIGQFGLYCFICPCCHEINYIDDGIDLTSENLIFPQHYYDLTKGMDISNERINLYVAECIEALRDSNNDDYYHVFTGTGNTSIDVSRCDEDKCFNIRVAKGYYEVKIPYTEKDKKKWCE